MPPPIHILVPPVVQSSPSSRVASGIYATWPSSQVATNEKVIVPIFVPSEGDERTVVEERICLTAVGGGNVVDSQLAPTLSKEVEADGGQV